MTILIIDDSGVMRRIHRNTLREHKVDDSGVIEADDGAKALKIATTTPVDVFLVDWNMPHLDGLELVKKLRAMPQYQSVPIIMVTSEAAKYNVLDAIKAGVTDYVVKPIHGEVMWQKIGKYFEE
jgi:two-component system chemotaxis response regulator CheY